MKKTVLEAIKEQQREILFGLKGYVTEKCGLCMNPFYGKKENDIQKDKPLAKEVYREVFLSHLNFAYNTFGNFGDIIPDKRMKELIL